MTRHSPILPANPKHRLAAFEAAITAAYDKLNEDSAYADADMDLCGKFAAFEVARDTLVAECKAYLEDGPVGKWPKGGASYVEFVA